MVIPSPFHAHGKESESPQRIRNSTRPDEFPPETLLYSLEPYLTENNQAIYSRQAWQEHKYGQAQTQWWASLLFEMNLITETSYADVIAPCTRRKRFADSFVPTVLK